MVQLALRENSRVGQGNVRLPGTRPSSDATPERIDLEIARIIDECHGDARCLLREHRKRMDALVTAGRSGRRWTSRRYRTQPGRRPLNPEGELPLQTEPPPVCAMFGQARPHCGLPRICKPGAVPSVSAWSSEIWLPP